MTHLIEKRHNDRFRDILTLHMLRWQMYRNALNEAPLGHDELQVYHGDAPDETGGISLPSGTFL